MDQICCMTNQLDGDGAPDPPGSLEGPGEIQQPGAQGGLEHDADGPHGTEPRSVHGERGLG